MLDLPPSRQAMDKMNTVQQKPGASDAEETLKISGASKHNNGMRGHIFVGSTPIKTSKGLDQHSTKKVPKRKRK